MLGGLLAATVRPALAREPADDPFVLEFERLRDGRLMPARLTAETDTALLYFGASWCGPCRAFQPRLRAAHTRLAAARRPIEIIYVGNDGSAATHRDYVVRERMPWLLVRHDDPARLRLRALGGAALPGLVLVDRARGVVRSSWHADGSSSPARMLQAMR